MANREELLQSFRTYVKKMQDYQSALALLGWDARTHMPKRGVEGRASAIGTLSAELFTQKTSDKMASFLEELSLVADSLDQTTRRMYEECKKQYDRQVLIPADRYEAMTVLVSQSESVWQEARKTSNFTLFQPYLQKIVDMKREFIGYWGYEDHPYNALLADFEPGVTVAMLDDVFAGLRAPTVNLLRRIEAAQQPDDTFLSRHYDPEKQRKFSLFILKEMGYDFDAGCLDETAHPFETSIAPGDIRVTTHFFPNFLNAALFGTIHEGGHALYEQNIAADLIGTNLHSGTSMGIHESQSRFWENVIGRSYEFWQRYYGDLKNMFPSELSDVSLDHFYAAINAVKPSLIRIEADELTYNLHIMLRYEIEKGLIAGDLQVKDLPEIWNAKMKDYLGVMPDSDANGVLQDIHWAGGDFGYFPSYSLGNIYAAQITRALEKDIPNYREHVTSGNLSEIRNWLVRHIYQYGSLLTPGEVLQSVTGESANSEYILDYFEKKFVPLYKL